MGEQERGIGSQACPLREGSVVCLYTLCIYVFVFCLLHLSVVHGKNVVPSA